MPQYGMTVSPEYDSDGNYAGSSISTHPNDAATDTSGRVQNWEQDYYQDSKGETHHHFSETELMSERQSPSDFDMDSYQSALVEAYPNLEQAIRWAEEAPDFTDEELDAYNQAFDNQDLSSLHAFYERLMPLFYQSQEAPPEPQQEEVSYDDMSDDDYYEALDEQGIIDETVAELRSDDFEITPEQADQLDTVLGVFDEGTVEHEIANVGLAIANGELDMAEAIEVLTDQFGDGAVVRAYYKLHSVLN